MSLVATWYLIGIMLATVIGAIFRPRLLRWCVLLAQTNALPNAKVRNGDTVGKSPEA